MIRRLAVISRAAIVLATVVVSVGASPALSAVDPVPNDVQGAFSDQALAYLRSTSETTVDVRMGDVGVPDFSAAAQFGEPHLIYTWSAEMIAGDTAADPIESSGEWTAPFMTADGAELGTYRVWRPSQGAGAEMAGYNNDVELAGNLAAMAPDSYLVHDAPSESWFSVKDDIVSPLGHLATREVPEPMSIDHLTPIVARRYARASADSSLNPWLFVGAVAAIVVGGAAATSVMIRRRRRPTAS